MQMAYCEQATSQSNKMEDKKKCREGWMRGVLLRFE